jgi:four helix bundle protein
MFGLVSQMRRASVSVTSNIAEGFGREFVKEKTQFYSRSLASITELQNQLLVARDVGYINNNKFQQLAEQSVKVHKLTNGLIKKNKERSRN